LDSIGNKKAKKRFFCPFSKVNDAIFTPMDAKWKIFVDTGGTFTDCLAQSPQGAWQRVKVLSSSALRGEVSRVEKGLGKRKKIFFQASWQAYGDLFTGYTFRVSGGDFPCRVVGSRMKEAWLEVEGESEKLTAGQRFELTAGEEAPILAARLATRCPLDKPLPPLSLRLGSTKGTNALLERKGARTALLITQGFADLLRIGTQQRPELFALHIQRPPLLYHSVIEVAERLNARGEVLQPLQKAEIDRIEAALEASGCDSVAIALLHAYRNPVHEKKLLNRLSQCFPQKFFSLSSVLAPAIKLLPRAETAVVNAYLSPVIDRYLQAVRSKLAEASLRVMSSAGGLTDADFFQPKDSLLSGPAGGVVGAAAKARQAGVSRILTLDMGGTSTDVARYDGQYEYQYESRVGDAHLLSPSLAIETVAAGGGSICSFDGHRLQVGPESAGARPGPACYGAGGPLSLTDVNLIAGRLAPDAFGIPLDRLAAERALNALSQSSGLSREALLQGLLQIANEKMADAIRKISVQKGYDPQGYALLAFGGAGGQHACQIADLLGMEQVLVPQDAGLLSAYGMSQAVVERFASQQVLQPWQEVRNQLPDGIRALSEQVKQQLQAEGISPSEVQLREPLLLLRFRGQEHSLEVALQAGEDPIGAFRRQYEQLYGHWFEDLTIELESIKVIGASQAPALFPSSFSPEPYEPEPSYQQRGFFEGKWQQVPVFLLESLQPGARITGPALVLSADSTTVLEAHWQLQLDAARTALIQKQKEPDSARQVLDSGTKADPIQLELFTNRFRSLAHEMGALLQRTAFSVNVKERLDFSCALLDAAGELVVNAPHIPVHLGSLGLCVRKVAEALPLGPGDVAITNHPGYGGSHLPDITLVQAVFFEGKRIAYLANRAHHAEIGGKRPGSMPPDAQNLAEEGVVIAPAYLVKGGKVDWENMRKKLTEASFPSRNPRENESDLRAGLASLRNGAQALHKLCRQYGPEEVTHYLQAIKDYAAARLAERLQALPQEEQAAREQLDDGTPLQVSWRQQAAKLHIDFSGSGPVHPANLNANPAIVSSVVLYVLRLLVGENIPLNEGLMQQVELHIPEGILNPAFPADPAACPAVVGGNTETSQRLVDTLLKALKLAACSQGSMNNLLFGNDNFGYYETIGGGSGAGPGFAGADAVHQHMTNTRITDPEVLELRYPVRLHRFAIRRGSGGAGRWKGGDGIIRELEFLEPVALTVLSQHREVAPYGMAGGEAGACGRQGVIRSDGQRIDLKGIDQADLQVGDRILIETPGGGGWGVGEG
jgi:5-oxoprolinase (ATP-hydrolysing)